jgi:hypothetical protein
MRAHEPDGLKEEWGVCEFNYVPDFRMNLGKYRVVGVMPQNMRYVTCRSVSRGLPYLDCFPTGRQKSGAQTREIL